VFCIGGTLICVLVSAGVPAAPPLRAEPCARGGVSPRAQ